MKTAALEQLLLKRLGTFLGQMWYVKETGEETWLEGGMALAGEWTSQRITPPAAPPLDSPGFIPISILTFLAVPCHEVSTDASRECRESRTCADMQANLQRVVSQHGGGGHVRGICLKR